MKRLVGLSIYCLVLLILTVVTQLPQSSAVAFVNHTANGPLTLTPLNKGLYLSRTREAGIISGYWRVIVILKPPSVIQGRHTDEETVKNAKLFITGQLNNEPAVPSEHYRPLTLRLEWLKQQISIDDANLHNGEAEFEQLRKKRGLFDAGGWLLGKVFGLATGDEISQLKDQVRQGHEQVTTLVHRTNEMATTMNKMIEEEARTRKYLDEHLTAIDNLYTAVKTITIEANRTRNEVNRLKKLHTCDLYVTSLERKYELERQARYAYRDQRMALENGRLTETVMPRDYLANILTKAMERELQTANLEWYYENTVVRPLWEEPTGLSYMVELPVTSTKVVGYHLQAFPFKMNEEWFRLVIHEYVGHNEREGQMTILKQCKGIKPMICEKNLRFQTGGLPCERALIGAGVQGYDECSLKLDPPAHTYAFPVALNKFVLTTLDEAVIIRCRGQPTITMPVKPGSHLLHFFNQDCQLQGQSGWMIDSLGVVQSKEELTLNMVDTSELTLPDIPLLESLEPAAVASLSRIDGVQIKQLQPLQEVPELLIPDHKSINSYLIIVLFAIILSYGVYRFLKWPRARRWLQAWKKACCPIKCCKKDGQPRDLPELIEMREVPDFRTMNPAVHPRAPTAPQVFPFGRGMPAWDPEMPEYHDMRNQYLGNNPLIPPRALAESRPPREILEEGLPPDTQSEISDNGPRVDLQEDDQDQYRQPNGRPYPPRAFAGNGQQRRSTARRVGRGARLVALIEEAEERKRRREQAQRRLRGQGTRPSTPVTDSAVNYGEDSDWDDEPSGSGARREGGLNKF